MILFYTLIIHIILFIYFLQTLNTESLGKVTNFSAVPGYGIQCVVSGIHQMVQSSTNSKLLSHHSVDNTAERSNKEGSDTPPSELAGDAIEMQTFGKWMTLLLMHLRSVCDA